MKPLLAAASLACLLAIASCSKKEDAPPTAAVGEFICSYAPSQSKIVSHISAAAGGAGAATAAIGQVLGLSVVTHSSGALMLSGAGGYIAGTLGPAAAGPIVIGVGVVVAGTSGVVELVCAPRNHPELVSRVESAAAEFAERSKSVVDATAVDIGAFVAEKKLILLKQSDEAFSFAKRKSIE